MDSLLPVTVHVRRVYCSVSDKDVEKTVRRYEIDLCMYAHDANVVVEIELIDPF